MDAHSLHQVCRQLRRQYAEGLPIIMLSGHDDEASILKGLQVGFLALFSFDLFLFSGYGNVSVMNLQY